MPKLIGYVRVSTREQEILLQTDALEKAGCAKNNIFTDKISGAKSARPGLEKCLASLKSGDTLLVWRLDRLGCSISHLIQIVEALGKENIGFRSLNDGIIDTTSASGELIFNIFSSLAQFERRLIQERTQAGLMAARARGRGRGRFGGRKKIPEDAPKVVTAKNMHKDHGMCINDICQSLNISRATFYRYLNL